MWMITNHTITNAFLLSFHVSWSWYGMVWPLAVETRMVADSRYHTKLIAAASVSRQITATFKLELLSPLLRWMFRTRTIDRTDKNETPTYLSLSGLRYARKMSADVSRQLLSATCKSSCNRIWSRVCCWLLQEDR